MPDIVPTLELLLGKTSKNVCPPIALTKPSLAIGLDTSIVIRPEGSLFVIGLSAL